MCRGRYGGQPAAIPSGGGARPVGGPHQGGFPPPSMHSLYVLHLREKRCAGGRLALCSETDPRNWRVLNSIRLDSAMS